VAFVRCSSVSGSTPYLHAVSIDGGTTWIQGEIPAARFAIGSTVIGAATPLLEQTLYATISNTGTVTDLQKGDPGFVNMQTNSTSQAVTWPATLPSGQDPDTDLPAGTSMTVRGKATNPSGSSTKSATVTPT